MQNLKGKRVVIYARVSTVKQADNDISINDQICRVRDFVTARGGIVVKECIEPGASATNTARPVYKQMIADALEGEFDVIAAFSLSRLFRNALDYLQERVRLKANGIKLVSITQDFADDPTGELALSMVALFDEYQSAENAKHVKRTMLANAKAGYWNGQTPPIGYKTVAVPQPKGKDRKKLIIDEETAHIPRFLFETYVNGTKDGPIGIVRLAALMNERGETLRGKRFHVSNVHAILSNTAYIGFAFFNKRCSKTRKLRPKEEWVPLSVPPLIPEDLFYQAQAQMAARDPKMGVDAAKPNTNLLTGKARCGTSPSDGCGKGMTTATGKSGAHRYYACNTRRTTGASHCTGRWTRMDDLDDLVVEKVIEHVLKPDRLRDLLATWLDQNNASEIADRGELKGMRSRLTMLDGERANVLSLVRKGLMTADDPQLERELANIAVQKRAIEADIELLERKLSDPARRITPEILKAFGNLVSDTLSDRGSPLRKPYVDLLVDKVEVGDDLIRISGNRARLAHAASGTPPHMVPKAIREWRARQDSNLLPQD